MNPGGEALALLEVLAAHPVVPPIERLRSMGESFPALLADLARGERSANAEAIRAVAARHDMPPHELADRARFLLSCLLLPTSGTYYDMLGVGRDATDAEIRKRWAALIRRYHPDQFGGAGGWLDDQARKLNEAYHTLRDPARRREYDRMLQARAEPRAVALRSRKRRDRLVRARWIPVGLVSLGLVVAAWAYTRLAEPIPPAPLPEAPNLLDPWQPAGSKADSQPAPGVDARPPAQDRDEAQGRREPPAPGPEGIAP